MSSALLPLLIMALLLWSLYKKVPVFSAFLEGAAKSLPLLGRILPSMAAMLTAISLIRSCGALDAFCTWVAPLCGKVGLDSRLLPLLLLRPLSGSAAAGMTALCLMRGRKLVVPSVIVVLLMAISRNYLMAHYPSDVLFAAIIGVASAFIAYYITRLIFRLLEDHEDAGICAFVLNFDLPVRLPGGYKGRHEK